MVGRETECHLAGLVDSRLVPLPSSPSFPMDSSPRLQHALMTLLIGSMAGILRCARIATASKGLLARSLTGSSHDLTITRLTGADEGAAARWRSFIVLIAFQVLSCLD